MSGVRATKVIGFGGVVGNGEEKRAPATAFDDVKPIKNGRDNFGPVSVKETVHYIKFYYNTTGDTGQRRKMTEPR